MAFECPSTPLNGKWWEVTGASDLPPEKHQKVEESQGHQ